MNISINVNNMIHEILFLLQQLNGEVHLKKRNRLE